MIKRYESKAFNKLWSDKTRYDSFLKVELASIKALYEENIISETEYSLLKDIKFNLKDIYKYEIETKHDVIAFIKACTNNLSSEQKWFHYGLTSTDVVDSANALILKKANNIIKKDIKNILATLKLLAYKYKDLPTIGRTHGIHAEVTSFGLKFLLYYNDIKRIANNLYQAMKEVEVIKLSGAVGNYYNSSLEHEIRVAKNLRLEHALISTQTLQRDRHANYISQIAILGAELEKIAVEIRNLSKTEVGEVEEFFSKNQKGSSAMPHKKNPIGSENITGLARVLRGYTIPAYENIVLWHERDISHSSVERIILRDSTTLINYMLNRMNDILLNIQVNEEKVINNIDKTKGVIFAQELLNSLITKGLTRNIAYDKIQFYAHKALAENISFYELIKTDEEINKLFKPEELIQIFDIKKHLKNVDKIFKRIEQK